VLPALPISTLLSVSTLSRGCYAATAALACCSLLQAMLTDPGGVPPRWDAEVRSAPHPAYSACPNTGVYKPPRSHFDVVTGRVVLNFDHFCPWVVNSIGYRNRKFFLLFLAYTCSLSVVVLGVLGPGAATALGQEGRVSFDLVSMVSLWCLASHAFVLLPLLLFTGAHWYMAAKNQTSIEDYHASMPYDLGPRRNLDTVLGAWLLLWLVPYGRPCGDGIRWEGRDGTVYGKARPVGANAVMPRWHEDHEALLPSALHDRL